MRASRVRPSPQVLPSHWPALVERRIIDLGAVRRSRQRRHRATQLLTAAALSGTFLAIGLWLALIVHTAMPAWLQSGMVGR